MSFQDLGFNKTAFISFLDTFEELTEVIIAYQTQHNYELMEHGLTSKPLNMLQMRRSQIIMELSGRSVELINQALNHIELPPYKLRVVDLEDVELREICVFFQYWLYEVQTRRGMIEGLIEKFEDYDGFLELESCLNDHRKRKILKILHKIKNDMFRLNKRIRYDVFDIFSQ